MYGSSLIMVTRNPRASSSAAKDADAIPLPSDDTTPPVIKMSLVMGCGAEASDDRPEWVHKLPKSPMPLNEREPHSGRVAWRAKPFQSPYGPPILPTCSPKASTFRLLRQRLLRSRLPKKTLYTL